MVSAGDALTYAYKHVGELPIHIDVYPPEERLDVSEMTPAVVYFHGGALTVGNRRSWFPSWLHRRVLDSGIAFISADYRLIPPATAHEILHDIKDLFGYLANEVNGRLQEDWAAQSRAGRPLQIDPSTLAVAGSSAGGLCAYLAAIHAWPRPKAVLSLYGMGGDMLTPHYLSPKTKPFFRGREILDPAIFSEYLYPACQALQPTADSPLAYHPATYRIPGYPANPRMLLGRLYLQMGNFLDYYTGAHSPSLSSTLRSIPQENAHGVHSVSGFQVPGSRSSVERFRDAIPVIDRHLFPQFGLSSSLPPMLLIHGAADTAVLVSESQNLYSLMKDAGVRAELVVLEGKEHSFDYEPTAEEEFGKPGGLFEQAAHFLTETLRSVDA